MKTILEKIKQKMKEKKDMADLLSMSERELADIGLNKCSVLSLYYKKPNNQE